jgi:hypothetical protein
MPADNPKTFQAKGRTIDFTLAFLQGNPEEKSP